MRVYRQVEMQSVRTSMRFMLAVVLSFAYIIDWSGFEEQRHDPAVLIPVVSVARSGLEVESDGINQYRLAIYREQDSPDPRNRSRIQSATCVPDGIRPGDLE